jgi:hypothetical protein
MEYFSIIFNILKGCIILTDRKKYEPKLENVHCNTRQTYGHDTLENAIDHGLFYDARTAYMEKNLIS